MIKFKAEDLNMFGIYQMGEDEKKLHILTQMNTKINRDVTDKIEIYVNKGIYKYKYNNFSLQRIIWK